jgi:dihydroorotate dehydrogenase
MGFPNDGAEAVARRLERDRRPGDVIGINLGKNKDTPNERAAEDYLAALDATRGVADYWVVNVSSPNTPGLRELQARGPLTELLGRVREAAGAVPLFVKLSPDLEEGALEEAVAAVTDARCAGVVATNTTLERPEGCAPFEGGLSGRPLASRARAVLVRLRELLGPEVPVISVGGIDGPQEARERLEAGADLLQLYSALVFRGPALPTRILRALGSA